MSDKILAYIPQRRPFVMTGEMTFTDGRLTQTKFTIPTDNLFVTNGYFTEPGLIENMAQTAAACTGFQANAEGKPAPVGYIAALKNVTIIELPRVNETITTEIIFEQSLLNFRQVKGRVMIGDKEIASSEFKIFVNREQ
jgi:3-hydroxymyristoyl/3-hydroxydecanoyl-(acyl carrier protein) dehydratase